MSEQKPQPNWIKIEKCQLWRTLGVTECDNCNSLIQCWGTDSQLPEPRRTPEQQEHQASETAKVMADIKAQELWAQQTEEARLAQDKP